MVSTASRSVQIGRQSNECVKLRCQVTISIGSREKNSRKTSASGKVAPSVSTQVMMRGLSGDSEGRKSPPFNTALARSAPAIAWVMVSMNWIRPNLQHRKQGAVFWQDAAYFVRSDLMLFEDLNGQLGGVRRNGDQQAPGSLRIEKERTIWFGNAPCEGDATA